MNQFPFSFLVCPLCSHSLSADTNECLFCSTCSANYPFLNKAPWLFSHPQLSSGFWKDNLNLLLQQTEQEVVRIQNSISHTELLNHQKQRLKKWSEAKKEFSRSLKRILSPLLLSSSATLEANIALRGSIPTNQKMGSYIDNIFRDWCWGDENGENKVSLEILTELAADVKEFENLLVLGSGACRLAYDFHREKKLQLTLATDVNPLFLLLAQEIIEGEVKSLFEFPVSPVDGKSFFVRRELKAPEPLKSGFHFAFADGMNPPFKESTFEALLTPWFIDIVPQDPQLLFKRFNFLLRENGLWFNFGSCYFNHPDYNRRYSPEDILEIAESSGFEILKTLKRKIPYLQNPASAYGRVEQTFSFVAKKFRPVEQPSRFVYLPDWLVDPNQVIPMNSVFSQFAAVHGFYSQVIGAIDGKTSLEMLASHLGPRYGLTPEDAIQSFGRFIQKVYETGLLFDGNVIS